MRGYFERLPKLNSGKWLSVFNRGNLTPKHFPSPSIEVISPGSSSKLSKPPGPRESCSRGVGGLFCRGRGLSFQPAHFAGLAAHQKALHTLFCTGVSPGRRVVFRRGGSRELPFSSEPPSLPIHPPTLPPFPPSFPPSCLPPPFLLPRAGCGAAQESAPCS